MGRYIISSQEQITLLDIIIKYCEKNQNDIIEKKGDWEV